MERDRLVYPFRIHPRFFNKGMVRRELAGRISRRRVARQMEGLAAASAEIHSTAIASPAWQRHPFFATKAAEGF
jgi:hypothetical protein